jgi:hypothetical protein
VVPNLKLLELFATFAFGDQVILDLIQSRWLRGLPQVADLVLVKLDLARNASSGTIAQMAFWREEALNLEVKIRGRAVQWS